jgi:hypothetical protein
MITAEGYSKDPTIIPEGIVVTFGKDMMEEQGGMKTFLSGFLDSMSRHDSGGYWMHKCTNLPKVETDHIYLIVAGRLWGRVYFGGFHRYNPDKPEIGYSADGQEKIIDWNYIILSGPFEKCPHKRALKGFQGFRYCTKLF